MPAETIATLDAAQLIPVNVTEEEQRRRARHRIRKHRVIVNVLRLALAVAVFGGWEVSTRTGYVDQFFYGQPSGIYWQIVTWITEGTAQGPLWRQIVVTLAETLLGFGTGMPLGCL